MIRKRWDCRSLSYLSWKIKDAATGWVPLADAEDVSDRRYLQGKFEFTMPFGFDFTTEFANVDIFHLEIELQ